MTITQQQAAELPEDQQVYLEMLEDHIDRLIQDSFDPGDQTWSLVIQVSDLCAAIPDRYRKRIGLFISILQERYKADWDIRNPDQIYPPSRILVRKA